MGLGKSRCCEIRNVPPAVDRTVSSTKILGLFVKEVPIGIRRENIGIAPYSYQVHADIDTGYFTRAQRTAEQGVQQSHATDPISSDYGANVIWMHD